MKALLEKVLLLNRQVEGVSLHIMPGCGAELPFVCFGLVEFQNKF